MCYNVRNEYTVYLNIEVNFMCENTCCFIGHRTINETEELKSKLCKIIEKLIVENSVESRLFSTLKSRFFNTMLKSPVEKANCQDFFDAFFSLTTSMPSILEKFLLAESAVKRTVIAYA